MSIEITFESLLRTEVFIGNLDARLQDHRRFWTDFVAPFVYGEVDDIFASRGDGQWADLDPRYARRKSVTHPGKSILRRDDAYFDAATGSTAPGSLLEASPLELVIGIDGGYFESQFGVNYPAVHEGVTLAGTSRRGLSIVSFRGVNGLRNGWDSSLRNGSGRRLPFLKGAFDERI